MKRKVREAARDVPSAGEIYRTNHGRGGQRARIVRIADDTVTLELVGRKNARVFELPMWFFLSRTCGWAQEPT